MRPHDGGGAAGVCCDWSGKYPPGPPPTLPPLEPPRLGSHVEKLSKTVVKKIDSERDTGQHTPVTSGAAHNVLLRTGFVDRYSSYTGNVENSQSE